MSAEPPRSGTADVGGGSRTVTVLVADDNEVALRLCRRVLEKAGYKVLTASDGLEAVSVALANSPDVILMDVAMPGIDGLEATRRIKQQRPGIAIVIASVLATASNRERFLASGAADVMMKPLRLSDLVALVARLTANRGPQMEDLTGPKLGSYELEGRVARTEQPTRRASPVQALREMVRMFIKYVTLKPAHDRLGENARRQFRELNRIGIALTAERDTLKLQELILTTMRRLTNADSASLWLKTVGDDGQPKLFLSASQNASIDNPYQKFNVPVDEKTVVGYAVTKGTSQIYDDAYNPPSGKPQAGKGFDAQHGYRTKSMLTVPMRNYNNEVVGAVQLINAKRSFETKLTVENVPDEVVSFRSIDLEMIESIASQAAIAIDNKNLLASIESLFDGFVRMSLSALELRDPSAASRSYRVEALTTGLARAVSGIEVGKYRDVRLTEDQFTELRYACLLHDLGVIGVREHISIKAKKLLPGQIGVIQARFEFLVRSVQVKFATEKLDVMRNGKGSSKRLEDIDRRLAQEVDELHRWMAAIVQANEPSVLPEETASILEQLSKETYQDLSGTSHAMLDPQEFGTLSIRKGVLDEQERLEMESHVTHSFELVKTIPWPPSMRSVPEIVFAHHEKLDGSGYPRGLAGDQISLQARMLTIADIYDALTAQDRPYKRAVSTAVALEILRAEANEGKLDKDLLDVFVSKEVFLAASGGRSAAAESSGTADVGGGGRSVTVLVADDNEVVQRLCRRVLEKAGYKVLIASDVPEAVSLALANSPDLILLDEAMPGINSLWATRQIKKQRPGMAIVIMSVQPTVSEREGFLTAGADDVLSKPFRLSDLIALVAKLTANRGSQEKDLPGTGLGAHEIVERRGGGAAHVRTPPDPAADSEAKGALPPFRTLAGPARLFATVIIVFGLASILFGWFANPIPSDRFPTLLYLAIGTQIAALMPIPWRSGHYSVIDPLLIGTGLLFPGAGVGLVALLATFDGRVPPRSIPWWAFFYNHAMLAAVHVLPSIAVAHVGPSIIRFDSWDDYWVIPVRTAAYAVTALGLNYMSTALALALVQRKSFWVTLFENVGLSVVSATLTISFAGGVLYLLLQFPVGYVIAPVLFAFVLAMRGSIADGQRRTVLKETTIDLAMQALDARDRYTAAHSTRVAELAGRLGEQLGLGEREVELLRTAGSLHDLGMIGVRDDILTKPGSLTDEEWELMRRHPDIGADMVARHLALAEVAPLVRHHHERWDGSGYPAGLKGDVIPFGARILSVADSFDAITGPRLHRNSLMTPIDAVEDISRRAGHWYDPNVVDALRELHALKPLEDLNRPEVPRRVTTLRVLRSNPGFRNLATAIAITSLGEPLTQVAALVTIFLATHDARFVALGFIAQALGTLLMSTVLGGVADKLPWRGLVVGLELLRAVILVGTAFMVASQHWWLIIPILFCLACVNAVVQPARQAAIPSLVPSDQVGKANAIVAATTMLTGAIGFALAGGLLLVLILPKFLFITTAATFVVAALVVLGIPNLGGGARARQISLASALGRSWAISAARPHLVIGGLAAFLLSFSFPALLGLAYRMSTTERGGQFYSMLEVALSAGIFAGAIMVSRFRAIGTMRTVGGGLFLTGVFSLAIWIIGAVEATSSVALLLVVVALFVASVGNPIYSVANQTAVLEVANPSNRSTVMAARFGLVQTASIVGIAVGGVVTTQYGAAAAYGVLGAGLVLLAAYAFGASRALIKAGGALSS